MFSNAFQGFKHWHQNHLENLLNETSCWALTKFQIEVQGGPDNCIFKKKYQEMVMLLV